MQLLGLFLQVTILNGQFGVLVDNFAQLILLSTGHTHTHTKQTKYFRVLSRTLAQVIILNSLFSLYWLDGHTHAV